MLRVVIVSFIIVGICVLIHVTGIILLAEWLIDRHIEKRQQTGLVNFMLLLILMFAIIIQLHLIESALWAAFFWWWDLFPNFETSLYFSMTSYTTIGYGDVVLPQK